MQNRLMRFSGTAESVRALPLFAEEATTLRYASDHVDVQRVIGQERNDAERLGVGSARCT